MLSGWVVVVVGGVRVVEGADVARALKNKTHPETFKNPAVLTNRTSIRFEYWVVNHWSEEIVPRSRINSVESLSPSYKSI